MTGSRRLATLNRLRRPSASGRFRTRLRVLDEPQLHHSGRRVGRARLFKVREVYAARAYAALATRLGSPKAIIGEAVREVAKADLRAEFRRQPSETIGSAPRADAAGNPDDDERVVGEALLPVGTSVRLRFP
jgi:hypothetical protein